MYSSRDTRRYFNKSEESDVVRITNDLYFPPSDTGSWQRFSLYRSEMTCVHFRTLSLPINFLHTRWIIKESEEEELAIFTAHKIWRRLPKRLLRQGNNPTFLERNHTDDFPRTSKPSATLPKKQSKMQKATATIPQRLAVVVLETLRREMY